LLQRLLAKDGRDLLETFARVATSISIRLLFTIGCVSHGLHLVVNNILSPTKAKRGGKIMTLWEDPKVPELCPVRHLMAYVYLIQINGVHLFPPKEALPNFNDLSTL
jgi:hypothetical protein